MKHLLNFKLFESISEEEMNRILDKINKSGINSLTWEEKQKLKSFTGDYKEEGGEVSFDKDGNLLINGKPPYQKITDDTKKGKEPEKTQPDDPKFQATNNLEVYKAKLASSNIIPIKETDKFVVGLDRFLLGSRRVYFLLFKEVKDPKSRVSCIRLVYNLNKTKDNIEFYDNYNNLLEFNKLQFFLEEHGLHYKTFNDAWFYIEENYINR